MSAPAGATPAGGDAGGAAGCASSASAASAAPSGARPLRSTLHLGDLRLDLLRDGSFRLDGGAMFGVVPKALWERKKPADAANRIDLGLNCLLVRGRGRTALLDTGIGDKWSPKLREIYGIERAPGIERELHALGVGADEVDLVLLSHLHFDHAGGNTRRKADGTLELAFPRARYVVQRGNLIEEAQAPNELRRASYLPENFAPVEALDRFDLCEGDGEVAPGLSVIVTGGHQRYHQAILVRDGGQTVCFPADLIPTAAHVDPPYIMAYDHFPLDTLAMKKALLARAASEGWILVLEHERDTPIGAVAKDGERFRFLPLEE